MSASNLLISLYDTPTGFASEECLDIIVRLSNIGASTATGTNSIFINIMEGWAYNWNPSQTTSTTIFDEVVLVNNGQFTFQPIILGQSYIAGYRLSTNETLSPAEVISFAIQVCSPAGETLRVFRAGLLKDSQGDNTPSNNNTQISIISG